MSHTKSGVTLAQRAREIYDAEGEPAMLAYLETRLRQPQPRQDDFQGYALLQDGSAVTVSSQGYGFGDQDRRQARASNGTLADAFAPRPAMFRGWPHGDNLWHHAMKLLEGDVLGCLDDGGDPVLTEMECYDRWPQLEDAVAETAMTADPDHRVLDAVTEQLRREARDLLDGLPADVRQEMKHAAAEALLARGEEVNQPC